MPVAQAGPRLNHRLRPEKTRQHAEGPGFESRHLHHKHAGQRVCPSSSANRLQPVLSTLDQFLAPRPELLRLPAATPKTFTAVNRYWVGDLGEVTYDVIGFPDDSVTGVRLHVFGEPSGNGFVLRTVESTTLCARGATGGRLCL